jgi:hypothetical protein
MDKNNNDNNAEKNGHKHLKFPGEMTDEEFISFLEKCIEDDNKNHYKIDSGLSSERLCALAGIPTGAQANDHAWQHRLAQRGNGPSPHSRPPIVLKFGVL